MFACARIPALPRGSAMGRPTTALRSRQYISATTAGGKKEKLVGVVTPFLTTAVTQQHRLIPVGTCVEIIDAGNAAVARPHTVPLLGIFLSVSLIAVYFARKRLGEAVNAKEPALVDPAGPTAPKVTAENLLRQFWTDVYGKECRQPRLIPTPGWPISSAMFASVS
jgi:hypothetical protein